MLAKFEKIKSDINHSFYVNRLKVDKFTSPLHFHPEVEILLIIEGTGTLFVSDSIENYGPGDVMIIGPNISHVWYSDDASLKPNSISKSDAIYIQFDPSILDRTFWELPELSEIRKILNMSLRGIRLEGQLRKTAAMLMIEISQSRGFDRILLLFSILAKVASSKEFKLLASPDIHYNYNMDDANRLNRVYRFLINNFKQEISLKDAASVANLSPSAFCRYFKERTNKTFLQLLTEIRIGHACRLISNNNYPVSDICYVVGFNNVSYFIKQFRKVTGTTPLAYKQTLLQNS
jgi:AraC-like DNA-binding protein